MAEAEAQAPPAEVVLPAEMPPCYLGFCKGDRAAALALYNKGTYACPFCVEKVFRAVHKNGLTDTLLAHWHLCL